MKKDYVLKVSFKNKLYVTCSVIAMSLALKKADVSIAMGGVGSLLN